MTRAITPGYKNLTLSSAGMSKIIEEVWSTLQVDEDNVIDDMKDRGHNTAALDKRLQEILASIDSHGSDVLSRWLRFGTPATGRSCFLHGSPF